MLAALAVVLSCRTSAPPGGAPFAPIVLPQPVPGAARGVASAGWRDGALCDVSRVPYAVTNGTNATLALQRAIDDCGDLPGGGTVLVPRELTLHTASLWLRSNLTLRVLGTLRSTATGSGALGSASLDDAPVVYTRRNSLMVEAHAGMLNGGRCVRLKQPRVGWDDCAEWRKLANVVIEGGGTGVLDGDGDDWYKVFAPAHPALGNTRPVMLDLLWVDGLTIRGLTITRPGYWCIHPCFANNVRVVNNTVTTWNEFHANSNTDGADPDSSWNVYIAANDFATGDDCISIKAGRDWSGRMVNISTQNVLAERNRFLQGHGVSIGSETSGWVRNVTIRDSHLGGADLAVRIKTARGRGGGAEDIVFENLSGETKAGVQLTLNYKVPSPPPTNATATPTIRRITLRNVSAVTSKCTGSAVGEVCALSCEGLEDSEIEDIAFDNVTITGGASGQQCSHCRIVACSSFPEPSCASGHA